MQIIIERPLLFGDVMHAPGATITLDDKDARELLDSGIAYPAHVRNIPVPGPQVIPGMVSCIMPTRNRRAWVPRAIACFLAQTHAPKELIVLDNGESVADLIPKREDIRYIRMAGEHKIGNLRNMCCQMARGEFIAHWDDDDWSAPDRLSVQIEEIGDKAVHAIKNMLFHGPGYDLKMFHSNSGHALGTSLFFRKEWWNANKFSPQHIGEDANFVQRAKGNIVLSDRTDLMVASTHPENTSPRPQRNKEWKKAELSDLPKGYTV